MKKFTGSILVLIILAASVPALAQSMDPPAPGTVVLSDEQTKYPLGLYLDILNDPSGRLGIEDVASPEYDPKFTPSQVVVPNFGYYKGAYWVRFHLKNDSSKLDRWLLELGFPNMHYVDLYIPSAQGESWTVKLSGLLRPFDTHDIVNRHIVFLVNLPPQAEQTYYMRFQNGASMTLPLVLWQPENFYQENSTDQLWLGLYYGALLIMLVYNLYVLYSIWNASYFYYVCFLASVILWSVTYDGMAAAYLWPKFYFLNSAVVRVFYIMLMASVLMFTDTFLEIKTRQPRSSPACHARDGGLGHRLHPCNPPRLSFVSHPIHSVRDD